MKADIIQAFIGAACEVLVQEVGEPIEAARPKLQGGANEPGDVTVFIGLAGDIQGAVIMSMGLRTALAYVAHIMGEAGEELDALGESGIGELANVIAGRAGAVLGEKGYAVAIAPPAIMVGRGSKLSTLTAMRMLVPIETPVGLIELQLAAK